jgi:hypothetical protein
MTGTMTHDQVGQLLPAAALEILEGDELVQVIDHARECEHCARLLAEYREVVAGLGTALPDRPLNPARAARLRARLVARAGRDHLGSEIAREARPFGSAVDRWAGWAVAAGLAGVLLVHHSIHRPVAYGWLVSGVLTLLLVAMAAYARVQRARLVALRRLLSRLNREKGETERSTPDELV